jgi:hypothetical protein
MEGAVSFSKMFIEVDFRSFNIHIFLYSHDSSVSLMAGYWWDKQVLCEI